MITLERLEEILDESPESKHTDRHMAALILLRDRIPYDVCKSIIIGADHDKVFLCEVEYALPYISEADAYILSASRCFIEDDCFSMFV
jgi:hypothetical protein